LVEEALNLKAAARLGALLEENLELKAEVDRLLSFGEAVVFGGWVRDALHGIIHGERLVSRDLDLVVHGSMSLSPDVEINHFGGRRFCLRDGLSIDCWELSKTLAFQRGLLTPSFANLLRSTVYRLNGCSIDLHTRELQNHGAVEDIAAKRISFNCTGYLNTYPEYQAFRAIDLAERLGYALDDEVASFVAKTLTKAGRQRFAQEVREHRKEERTERLHQIFQKHSQS
jgi:hypothetical protein